MNKRILLCLLVLAFVSTGCQHLRWQTPSVGFDFHDWQVDIIIGLPLPTFTPAPEKEVVYESPLKIPPTPEAHQIYWTEPKDGTIRYINQRAIDIVDSN